LYRPLPAPVTNVLDLVGNTPMVELRRIATPESARIFVKMESLNPGGSVKDRLGLALIRFAEANGLLKPGGTIIEPTAGNTGIGLALAGKQLGYRVILTVPSHFSVEKQQLMRALGGEVVLTDSDKGMAGAIEKAQELSREIPGSHIPQQFRSKANAQAHYDTTGPEIFEQLSGNIDAWVCGSGTGGTFSGVARYLKDKLPSVRAVIVEPQGSVLQGGKPGPHDVEGIGASFIPESLDTSVIDEYITIPDPPAFHMVARLAAEEGILAGSSAGANVAAALQIAERIGRGRRVVTVSPDAAERYLSKGIFTKCY
jgi:cysteine synthase A